MTIVTFEAMPIVAGALGLLVASAGALVVGIVWRSKPTSLAVSSHPVVREPDGAPISQAA